MRIGFLVTYTTNGVEHVYYEDMQKLHDDYIGKLCNLLESNPGVTRIETVEAVGGRTRHKNFSNIVEKQRPVEIPATKAKEAVVSV